MDVHDVLLWGSAPVRRFDKRLESLVTVLSLDHRVAWLGSSACDPGPMDQYRVKAEEFHFTIHLRAVAV